MHFRLLDDGVIHVYLKDSKERDRQERSGTKKSFCTATHLHFYKDQVTVFKRGRLKLIATPSLDLEAHLQNVHEMRMEVELTKGLNHPHIVSYLDSFLFERDQKRMKIYAYAPIFEDDLFLWKKTNFPAMEAKKKNEFLLILCDHILRALAYLHEKKIIHNDIKHRNIYYIKKEGMHHFSLADFGAASRNIKSEFKGSLEFLPPEKALSKGYVEGSYLDTGFATDLWDLGITLYTLHEEKFPLFSKLMRKQFELHHFLQTKCYSEVQDESAIIEAITKEENGDRLIEKIDGYIACLKSGNGEINEPKCIEQVFHHIKKAAAEELQRMEVVPMPAKEQGLLGHIVWHLLQPDPAKRPSAEMALALLK